ncbi:MAG: hypothetical protein LBB56_08450 [Chitinispirillales bacterium]|jgi:hypothetical protein|nr:hypothetical protein [Chitinispirillales bacterium]
MINFLKIIFTASICLFFAVSCTPNMARIRHDEPSVKSVDKKETVKEESVPSAEEPAESAAKETGESGSFGELFDDEITEFTEEETPPEIEPEPKPVFGGKIKMYVHRGFLDETISRLVNLSPFSEEGREKALFEVTDSTYRRIELKLIDPTVRANGKRVTALDFIEHWSQLLKTLPGQGLSLFRNVQGVQSYIEGKDPLVKGFAAFDEKTVRIRLERADPQIFRRLNSPKLITASLMLGPYYFADVKEGEVKILPNKNTVSEPVFLQEWDIQLGGDSDVMQSFSLGMYSAVIIWSQSDLQIAKTQLDGKVTLNKLLPDRYFLSCINEDPQIRGFIRSKVSGADLLQNTVKAEGEEIYSVTVQNEMAGKQSQNTAAAVPQLSAPLKIVYRIDDPVSKIIAEKLSADLNQYGLTNELKGSGAQEYETALLRKEYDCAVGWVPQTVLDNVTEQLHLSTTWFSDETDSQARLRDNKEIPLFSIDNYLLLRDDVKLHGGKLTGIWTESR